jgi:hypothetical protein
MNNQEVHLKTHRSPVLTYKTISAITHYWGTIHDKPNIEQLTNPFFIGYGNPRAKMLFVGHECAYSPAKSPYLFLNENILNIYHWYKKCKYLNLENLDDCSNTNNHQIYCSPTEPRKGSCSWNRGHNFGWYKRILNIDSNLDCHKSNQSMFSEIFITELNSKPAKRTQADPLEEPRLSFLSTESFYQNFEYVVIGGRKILSNSVEKGKNREFNIFGFKFKMNHLGTCFDCENNAFKVVHQLDSGAIVTQYQDVKMNGKNRRLIITGNLSSAGRYMPRIIDISKLLLR